jgi:hypothetical protein
MATQEQWEVMKEWAEHMSPIGATLLELRARVEALEAKLASPPCREVADWLEQRRAADAHWIIVALLREEAGR